MADLALKLRPFDKRVLRALADGGRPRRQRDLALAVYRPPSMWPNFNDPQTTPEQLDELRSVLRGAQHLGLARCARGGWWTITPLGRHALEQGAA